MEEQGSEVREAAATGRAPHVVATGLSKTYGSGSSGKTALADCDLELYPGRLVAVMGPSGSGKSTLLHLLSGLDVPDQGEVQVGGLRVSDMSEHEHARFRAERVGFVLQADNLIPALTVRENVAAPLMFSGVSREASLARAEEMLDRVGILDRSDAFPADVSGGESQRAAVARACSTEPQLLIADEPTGSLDTESGAKVIELFQGLVRQTGAAGVVATHDPQIARAADEVWDLTDGRLRKDSDPT